MQSARRRITVIALACAPLLGAGAATAVAATASATTAPMATYYHWQPSAPESYY